MKYNKEIKRTTERLREVQRQLMALELERQHYTYDVVTLGILEKVVKYGMVLEHHRIHHCDSIHLSTDILRISVLISKSRVRINCSVVKDDGKFVNYYASEIPTYRGSEVILNKLNKILDKSHSTHCNILRDRELQVVKVKDVISKYKI